MTPVAVYYHPLFMEHETGDHPENKKRLVFARKALSESGLDLEWVTPQPASLTAISRVHEPDYIELVEALADDGGGRLDLDTIVSSKSYEAALHAAGAGLMAVERCVSTGQKAFMLVRPPGHHAYDSRGMGFCLFNNVAVAATYALDELGLERVLVLDWDVHHGNGTQAVFYNDPRVLFLSMHQAGHYPGTGVAREVGNGTATGSTVNVALRSGDGDGAVSLAFELLVAPLFEAFRPQLTLVSAGYDSQRGDLLGGLRYSQHCYQWMAARLLTLCEETGASGPLCFLEGGYVPKLMAASVVATVRGLLGQGPAFTPVISEDERADVWETLVEIRPFWKDVF